LARTLNEMREMGYWIVGLDSEAEKPLSEAKGDGATALVLGAEGMGLRRLTAENCDSLARLPVAPGAQAAGIDSLNVSAAAAVALYELVRAG
jgi:23S rRNA (guanosine2251-2'-O)-methyltransferase